MAEHTPIFYIINNKAFMPNSCFGGAKYRKIAVMKSKNGKKSRNIVDTRNHEVIRVWDRVYEGKTDACAAAIAKQEALAFMQELKAEYGDAAVFDLSI